MRMNYPYGHLPQKRLKNIHGYDMLENSFESTNSGQSDLKSKQFALEEEIYIEFEAKYTNHPDKDP